MNSWRCLSVQSRFFPLRKRAAVESQRSTDMPPWLWHVLTSFQWHSRLWVMSWRLLNWCCITPLHRILTAAVLMSWNTMLPGAKHSKKSKNWPPPLPFSHFPKTSRGPGLQAVYLTNESVWKSSGRSGYALVSLNKFIFIALVPARFCQKHLHALSAFCRHIPGDSGFCSLETLIFHWVHFEF